MNYSVMHTSPARSGRQRLKLNNVFPVDSYTWRDLFVIKTNGIPEYHRFFLETVYRKYRDTRSLEIQEYRMTDKKLFYVNPEPRCDRYKML